MRRLAFSVLFALVPTGSALAETIAEPVALLQGLDKITARVSKFEAPVSLENLIGQMIFSQPGAQKKPEEGEAPSK